MEVGGVRDPHRRGHRSTKLREAFMLATDKVAESLSSDVICSSFPNSYREHSDVLEEFRLELIDKLRSSMVNEFENISDSIGVFTKLDLIDDFLRSEPRPSFCLKDSPKAPEAAISPEEADLTPLNARKRSRVSVGQSAGSSLDETRKELSQVLFSNLANVRLKIHRANNDHYLELSEELSRIEKSTVSLSKELVQVYSDLIECVSDTNKRMFDIVPECVPGADG